MNISVLHKKEVYKFDFDSAPSIQQLRLKSELSFLCLKKKTTHRPLLMFKKKGKISYFLFVCLLLKIR